MGLLILGLGGFGVTNLGGTVRSVGAVGETEIDVNTYARTLQNEMQRRTSLDDPWTWSRTELK